MINNSTFAIFAIVLTLSILTSCEKGNETNISVKGNNDSHNMGKNCMTCHKQGGDGEGWFNVAGTVFDSNKIIPLPQGLIHLYTQPDGDGTLKYTLEVDGRGNFYTTENIDFGEGLYPAFINGETKHYMSAPVQTGQCNSCHGFSTDRISGE